jgi:TatD DNase family protein
MFFDTHAHLTDERFHADLPAVLDRARAAGVEHLICVATTAPDSVAGIQIAQTYGCVWASVGIQPNHVAEAGECDWTTITELASSGRVVAIGETGLDRHWDYTPFPDQEDYFSRHLELARRQNFPVIIHCREAEPDILRMLRESFDRSGPIRGVMHSFTGDTATALACCEIGLHISFAGMVTYKSAENLRSVARSVPLDRILVETDCPYLAPVPERGKRNEPAFVLHTAALLARELSLPIEEFAASTTANALCLFGLAKETK